ncbi:MAG: hypothetical protein R3F60_26775 [bacterium]
MHDDPAGSGRGDCARGGLPRGWRPPLLAGESFEQARLTLVGHFALWAFGQGGTGWYVVQVKTTFQSWVVLVDGASTREHHPGRRACAALAGAQTRGMAWLWGVLSLAGDRLTELLDDGAHSQVAEATQPAPVHPGRMLTPIS